MVCAMLAKPTAQRRGPGRRESSTAGGQRDGGGDQDGDGDQEQVLAGEREDFGGQAAIHAESVRGVSSPARKARASGDSAVWKSWGAARRSSAPSWSRAMREASSMASRMSWVTKRAVLRTAAAEVEEEALQVEAGDGVERGEGLVEEEQGRIGGQGAGDADALALSAGEFAGVAGAEFGGVEADGGQSSSAVRAAMRSGGQFCRRGTRPTLASTVQWGKSPPSWMT